MVKFVFPSEREGWINGVRGKVIQTKTWTETHVSSSGGGGYLHNGSGQVHAPTVRSTIVEKGETWVKTRNGKDICIPSKISGIEGHDVCVLWGNLNEINSQTGPYLYWRNFSTDKHSYIGLHDRRMFLSRNHSFKGLPTFMFVFILCVVGGAIIDFWAVFTTFGFAPLNLMGAIIEGGISGGKFGFFAAVAVLLFAWMLHRPSENKKIAASSKKFLEDLARLSACEDIEFNG